jgi:hypothetical protein
MLFNPLNNFKISKPNYNKNSWDLILSCNNYHQSESSTLSKSIWLKDNAPIIIVTNSKLEIIGSKEFELDDIDNIIKYYNRLLLKKMSNNIIIEDINYEVSDVVYVIGNDYIPFVKIGKTKNIKKRLMELQIVSPYQFNIKLLLNDKYKTLEKYLHNELKEYNVRGEWFTLDVITIIKNKYNNLII